MGRHERPEPDPVEHHGPARVAGAAALTVLLVLALAAVCVGCARLVGPVIFGLVV